MLFENKTFLQHTQANPISAEPQSGEFRNCVLDNGVRLELWGSGILRCSPEGNDSQHRIVLSSGIHGNETAPIEIIDQLLSKLLNNELKLANELLLIIGNPVATNEAERFIDLNLNRLFSGAHQSHEACYETKRAAEIEACVSRFYSEDDLPRIHYDLHTAIRGSEFEKFAVYPYLESQAWSKTQLGFLERCGIEAVLLSNKPSGTFSYYTSNRFNADAFTVELGSVKPFGQNEMNRFDSVVQGLEELVQGEQTFESEPKQLHVFSVIEEVIKYTEQFKLHFAENAKNFSVSDVGTLLASDVDYQYLTKQEGERFVFPNQKIPPGNRAMLVVAPTHLI